MQLIRKFIGVVAVLGLTLVLSGCNELADDTYGAVFTNRDKFQVFYSGSVDVELSQGEAIHLYCAAGGQQRGNVKVVGNFHFAVHGCGVVKADKGATVTAYDCTSVKAMPGTTVVTYNTPTVYAHKAVAVEAHGRTVINRYDVDKDNATPAGTEEAGN
jgi:hypothetical protein